MAEMYELHRRAGDALAATVRRVRDGHLHRPTPCTEWDVRELLHHITWSNLWVSPLVDGKDLVEVAPTLEGDVLGDDPVGSPSAASTSQATRSSAAATGPCSSPAA